jgi:6,7-dimethyl-8-ribityllumazine synthase
LVKTEWNAAVVDSWKKAALRVLHQHGIRTETLVVPGAVEIPFAIQHSWKNAKKKDRPAGFIALVAWCAATRPTSNTFARRSQRA